MLSYLLVAIGTIVAITLYIIWNDAKRRRIEKKRRQNKREGNDRIKPRVYTRPQPKTEPIKTEEPKPQRVPKASDKKSSTSRPVVSEEKKENTLSQPTVQKKSEPSHAHATLQETPAPHQQRFRWQTEIPQSLPFPRIATPASSEANNIELPEGNYPPFSHQRLIDMGLSDAEAKEFVQELIPQIEEHIPQIEAALKNEDFQALERLTHSIKGSSTNLGTGGIADASVAFNDYLKTGDDAAIAARYLEILKTHLSKLKERYAD